MPATALKVLIVLTSHSQMGATSEPTGFWLEEFTTPYYAFARAEVEVASIRGGRAPIDPRSLQAEPGTRPPSVERFMNDEMLKATLENTRPLDDVEQGSYDIVFLPGGHGTMWDLPTSQTLSRLVSRTLERGDVVGAVCHGPAGLVAARYGNGKSVIDGKRVAGFTNSEERAVKLDHVVPFLLETRLRELGGLYQKGPDFQPFAVTDGHLVTGQNPASSLKAAELAIAAARARP